MSSPDDSTLLEFGLTLGAVICKVRDVIHSSLCGNHLFRIVCLGK